MITMEQLLEVFVAYNEQIWPMQVAAYLLGLVTVYLAFRRTSLSRRVIPAVLSFFWLWVALLFWLPSGSQGFLPGFIFTGIFLIQGIAFLLITIKSGLALGFTTNVCGWAGIAFIVYAMVGYPLVGVLLGHVYPQMSPFGLTPCPLVTFTLGLFLLSEQNLPIALWVIPVFYSLSGFLWISIGMWEDVGMVASGLMGIGLILFFHTSRGMKKSNYVPANPQEGGWSLDLEEKQDG